MKISRAALWLIVFLSGMTFGAGRAFAQKSAIKMTASYSAADAQTREKLQVELTHTWARTRKTMLFVTHDIGEAVFLSDRVVVFSARPARAREIVDIRVPRAQCDF
jgi:NitT/TauT family transport system ATP-binding protein